MGIPKSVTNCARRKTLAIMGLCISISAGCTTGLMMWQRDLERTSFWMSLTPAVGIFIFNYALHDVSERLVPREGWPTRTEADASAMTKLTVTQVTNTVLVIVLLNYPVDNWYVSGGLVHDMAGVIIGCAIFPQFLQAIGIDTIVKDIIDQRFLAKFNPDNPGLMTQALLNEKLKAPPIELPRRYAAVLKMFLLGLVFSGLIPLATPVLTLGLGVAYFVDKSRRAAG